MLGGRRRWSPMENTAISEHAVQHYRWLHLNVMHQTCSTVLDRFFPQNPTRSPHYLAFPPQSVIRRSWANFWGRFVFWFCLILLQQPSGCHGNLVTRDAIQTLTTKNTSLSHVNTLLLQNLPLLGSRMEHKSPTQVCLLVFLALFIIFFQ